MPTVLLYVSCTEIKCCFNMIVIDRISHFAFHIIKTNRNKKKSVTLGLTIVNRFHFVIIYKL